MTIDLTTLAQGREHMRERCQGIAAKYFQAVGQIDGRAVIHIERTSLTGKAYIQTPQTGGGLRAIEAPKPLTRRSLYIVLHECAHHLLRHLENKERKPKHLKEFEAERWAHETMRAEGLAVPRKETMRAKAYVARKIRQAIRRGAKKIDAQAAAYADVKTLRP